MHFALVELRKMKKLTPLVFAKATLLVILSRQNARLQILFFEVRFFKGERVGGGPAAEGKAVGPSLKLEVGFRRNKSEHTMHPLQGAADLKGFALCRRPLCHHR